MTTQHQARLPAATAAAIDALRHLAALLGADVACILLNTADMLEQARDSAAGEMHPSDRAIAERVEQQIADLSRASGQRSMAKVSAPGFLADPPMPKAKQQEPSPPKPLKPLKPADNPKLRRAVKAAAKAMRPPGAGSSR